MLQAVAHSRLGASACRAGLAVLLLFICTTGTRVLAESTSSPTSPLRFPRALVDVAEAADYEAHLAPNYERMAPQGESWFRVLEGTSRVLVTAPHATAQTRDGKLKPADAGTGSLALMLNRLAKVTILQTTWASPSDPNFYDDNLFKDKLKKLIAEQHPRLIIDLHASHPDHPYDVDFGTMGGASLLGRPFLLDQLASHLHTEGLVNFSQDYFAAAKQQSVTKFTTAVGIPTIQCEINSTWLLPPMTGGSTASDFVNALQYQRFAELLEGLVRFISDFDAQTMP